MKISLVATSVGVPDALRHYAANIHSHGHRDVDMIIVGDRGSTDQLREFCAIVTRDYFSCTYLDIESQRALLADQVPELWKHLRFDSRQRRNLGFLAAWINGADVLVSIDAQDQLGSSDFLGPHKLMLESTTGLGFASSSSWFNQAVLLEEANHQLFSLRGFPIALPKAQRVPNCTPIPKPVAANSGICLGASDLDAATKLQVAISVTRTIPGIPPNFRLMPGVWAPFPGHNLSFRRELVPAYFLSPYVGRYDDIWAGLIVTRIAHHLGQCISFGEPCVERLDLQHDIHSDFEQELVGYRQTIRFGEALRSIPLVGRTYHECFGEIAAALGHAWPELPRSSAIEIEARNQLLIGLKLWHELFATIQAKSTSSLLNRVLEETPAAPVHQVVGQRP